MLSADVITAIDGIFAAYHRERESPDVAYGVVRDGALIHHGGLCAYESGHVVGPDSISRIASMTKSFTAATVMILRDEGCLALDEPIDEYVPEVADIPAASSDAPPLTLRLLLTMSGGFSSDDPWADRQESISPDQFSTMLRQRARFSSVPGTRFEYSNLGYAIIGRAITNVAGAPYRDVVRDRLLEPLGLLSTRFGADEVDSDRLVVGNRKVGDDWEPMPFDSPGEFSSIGGLYSSVRDLASWVGWFTESFRFPSASTAELLSTASRREMQQMYRLSGSAVVDGAIRSTGYGFGLNVIGDSRWGEFVSHSGGYPGYGSHMRWHPASGYGVIALGNAMYASTRRPATDALDTIIAAVGSTPRPVQVWPETLQRHREVHRLLLAWDDDLAASVFSPNVDLDQPRDRRRSAIDTVVNGLGVIDPDPVDVRSLQSGAEVTWTIAGSTGSATVEIWLTPERDPSVQTLNVTAVVIEATTESADDANSGDEVPAT